MTTEGVIVVKSRAYISCCVLSKFRNIWVSVTRLMAPPQPMANGPAAAQEGGVPMPSADGNNGGGLVPHSLGRN